MKFLKSTLLTLFFAVAMTGCSDEDTEVVGEDVSADSFTYAIDGRTMTVTMLAAQKSDDRIVVMGSGADGRVIQVLFNKYGDLEEVGTYSATDSLVPSRTSYHYYKSHYFDFQLVSIDETTKKVRVTFSGKLYDDEYDLDSEYSTVEGSFTTTYVDAVPAVPGMHVAAKINGNAWYATETGDQEGGFFEGDDITLYASNDSQYTLSMVLNHATTAIGTYNFTGSSPDNKVVLSVYETASLQDITFPTSSGTLIITEKTVGPQYTTIAGTFSLTAFNPFTQNNMTVSNGTFKRIYLNY